MAFILDCAAAATDALTKNPSNGPVRENYVWSNALAIAENDAATLILHNAVGGIVVRGDTGGFKDGDPVPVYTYLGSAQDVYDNPTADIKTKIAALGGWDAIKHEITSVTVKQLTGSVGLRKVIITSKLGNLDNLTFGEVDDANWFEVNTENPTKCLGVGQINELPRDTAGSLIDNQVALRAAANLAATGSTTIDFTVAPGYEAILGIEWTPSAATAVTNTYSVNRKMPIAASNRTLSPAEYSGNWATSSTAVQAQTIPALGPGYYSITITAGAVVSMNGLAVSIQAYKA